MFSASTKSAHGPATEVNYIESVFSTYLYTGNGSTQTITNNIDLAGKGGMVWAKERDSANNNIVVDTTRGTGNNLITNQTATQSTGNDSITAFNSNGFSLGTQATVNYSTGTFVSWTFRKQPKFFDVVTFTATGSSQAISHSLGSTPGMIFFKRTDGASNWLVWNRTYPAQYYQTLNTTAASADLGAVWCTPTSTNVTISTVFGAGQTWVAYLFAHNAGGFGTSGTDNVISCGSFTGNTTVNLGYEPQYIMLKNTSAAGGWYIHDVMRGWPASGDAAYLYANSSAAESSTSQIYPNATGFSTLIGSGTYIYMAIRRPMKVPTDATTVFKPVAQNGGGTVTTGFPVDLSITPYTRSSPTQYVIDRLRGTSSTASQYLITRSTNAEASNTSGFGFDNNTGYLDSIFTGGGSAVYWNFSRRPGFFDEVCYAGTGTNRTQAHNLGVVPELIITKARDLAYNWYTYANFTSTDFSRLTLNQTNSAITYGYADGAGLTAQPTSSGISLGSSAVTNGSGYNYVAYLFATCPGVSKVGSYTGNGGTQAISCGFTGGARFVLIKRTDSTGDWYVYDTARGMTTLVDPYLLLNSTAAESATLGSVTTTAGGFTVNASILAAINTSGASYIFLAIA